MRLHTLLGLTHLLTAGAGALAAWVLVSDAPSVLTQATAVLGVVCLVLVVAVALALRLRRSLRLMVQAVAKAKSIEGRVSGVADLDLATGQLVEYAQRWAEAAREAREQARDIEDLLLQFDRRATRGDRTGPTAAGQVRSLMAGISDSVDGELRQLLEGAGEIADCVHGIAERADEQSDAVSKTTTYVEQLSADIDTVVRDSADARERVASVREGAAATIALVAELTAAMEQLRLRMESNERRLRAMGDQSRETASIVDRIAAIASRTDLLALNASIESVRAGEQGRGFAIVAEEVHRLAEQSAQATREVAALLESTQLEAQDAIQLVADEQATVVEEMNRVKSAHQTLEAMLPALDQSAEFVSEISGSAEHQLLMTHDVVLAVERIANLAKTTRSHAEKARWTTKTLSTVTGNFNTALGPLRQVAERPPNRLETTESSLATLQNLPGETAELPAIACESPAC